EQRRGIDIGEMNAQRVEVIHARHSATITLNVETGIVVVFSDAHYWPGLVTTAHRALLKVIDGLKPRAVICNGDAFDGAAISRFPRIGWDKKPSVKDELRTVTERLEEIRQAAGRAHLTWPLGNHDARFETRLAQGAPEFEGVSGFHLKDHFPEWGPCWATRINQDVVVKHRMRSGIHATHNNTINSGVSIVTGHLHQLKVTPFSDYRGRRFGVDTGTLADPGGPQFIDYTEAGPVNWASGFAVLTFHKGVLLPPELVEKMDEDNIVFRGTVIPV
ncbi:MAG: metallophosphoesterase, partial [Sulfuricaulis sp.]|nr:metallophosphoesterase [Sulfuricaulis sp.]